MKNNNLNNESTSIYDELRSIHEELRDVASFIHELKNDYEVLEDKIELSTMDILRLLAFLRLLLLDGGMLTWFLTDTYQVTILSTRLKVYILL